MLMRNLPLRVGASGTDLTDGDVVPVAADHLHLDALHQTLQLIPDVPGSPHGAELDEVLVAPLRGEAALHPLRRKHSRTAFRIRDGCEKTSRELLQFAPQTCWVLFGNEF